MGVDKIHGSSHSLGWPGWWDRSLPPSCHHAFPWQSAVGVREFWAGCSPLMEGAAPALTWHLAAPANTATSACCYPFLRELVKNLRVCEAINGECSEAAGLRWMVAWQCRHLLPPLSPEVRCSWGPGSPRGQRFYNLYLQWSRILIAKWATLKFKALPSLSYILPLFKFPLSFILNSSAIPMR